MHVLKVIAAAAAFLAADIVCIALYDIVVFLYHTYIKK